MDLTKDEKNNITENKNMNNQAKQELKELYEREPKGDQKKTLGLIIKGGEQVERDNGGRAYWDNYLKCWKNHEYDRK